MKRKKLTRSKLVKKLDAIFSKYIRLKYSDKRGICKCYTCGDKDHYKNMQCGHFVSRSNYKYRRDEKNCRPQDYKCNIIHGGNYKFYTCNMIDEYGKDRVDCMINDKEPVKITTPEIEEMIEKYEILVEKMLTKIKEVPPNPHKRINIPVEIERDEIDEFDKFYNYDY